MPDTKDEPITLEEFRPTSPSDYLFPLSGEPQTWDRDDYKEWYENALANEKDAEDAWLEARAHADELEAEAWEWWNELRDVGRRDGMSESEIYNWLGTPDIWPQFQDVDNARDEQRRLEDEYLAAKEDRERAQREYEQYDLNRWIEKFLKWLAVALMILALVAMGYTVTKNDPTPPKSKSAVEQVDSEPAGKPAEKPEPVAADPNPAPNPPANSGPVPAPAPAGNPVPAPAVDSVPAPAPVDESAPAPAGDPGPLGTDQTTADTGTTPDTGTTWTPGIIGPDVTVPEFDLGNTDGGLPQFPFGTGTGSTQPQTQIGEYLPSVGGTTTDNAPRGQVIPGIVIPN